MTRYALLVLALILWTGCDDSSTGSEDEETAEFILVEDLDARGSTGSYTFFDLDEGTTVDDSTSTEWDLAFKSTDILVNSGQSGPGSARGALYTGAFDDIDALPGDVTLRAGGGTADPAITTGSGDGWYLYSGQPSHLITPIPGRVIFVETSESRYAKLRIVSYYQGAPDEPGTTDSRYYTFEYVLSPEGSTSFE